MKIKHILFYLFLLLCTISCSTTKFVNDGEYLLNKVQIVVDSNQVRTNEIYPYFRQQPNYKTFGIFKWPLFVYNWSGRNEKNWLNKQLRRIGESPVIMDTVLIYQTQAEIERLMVNKGYLNVNVATHIDTTKRKKANVVYRITPNQPFRINNYSFLINDLTIDSLFRLAPQKKSWLNSLFKTKSEEYIPLIMNGNLFDRDVLENERQRLTTILRKNGYYAFNAEYINFIADTISEKCLVDLELIIKPILFSDTSGKVLEKKHQPYYINQVKIYSDYDPLNIEHRSNFIPVDSILKRNIWIYYSNKGRSIRPGALQRRCYIVPGMKYNEYNVEQTYSSLTSMRALRYVNIQYDEIEKNDTLKLNCNILTSPAKNQGFGVEVEGTNSGGDFGFASGLTYQHRNLFKGSELFSAKLRGAYESLSTDKEAGLGNYWEFAAETSILFPTFVFPYVSSEFRRKVRATTELKVSYNQQRRPEYRRALLAGGWSYIWQNRMNTLARHTFKLLDINYVYLPFIEDSFKLSLPETTALYNYSDQFIVSSGYSYSFNNYDPLKRDRNTYSFRVALEMAGNILYGFSKILNTKKDDLGRYKLFGLSYSQFFKSDVDFAKSLSIDNKNSFAFHIGIGVGYPYGNAKVLPFERRYFSGGANSNRGWAVRSLGPGSMQMLENHTFVSRVGDIRLDANIEYRTKLFWKFEMAAYIDGGNIWTIRNYEEQPNGNFEFSRFYKEIAVSYGLGLRLDFEFFLIRFDTGMKAYNPQKTGRNRWAILHPDRINENFAWHFAVGYPF